MSQNIDIKLTGDSSSAENAFKRTENAAKNLDKSVNRTVNQKINIDTSKFNDKIKQANFSTEKFAGVLNTVFQGSGVNFPLLNNMAVLATSLYTIEKAGKGGISVMEKFNKVVKLNREETAKEGLISIINNHRNGKLYTNEQTQKFIDFKNNYPISTVEKVKAGWDVAKTNPNISSLAGFGVIGIAAAVGVIFTKVGSEMLQIWDESNGKWSTFFDKISNKFSDAGDYIINFFSGFKDILDEANKVVISNFKRVNETGISKEGTKSYLDNLDNLMINTSDKDAKAKIQEQIDYIKNGKGAETFYGNTFKKLQSDNETKNLKSAGKLYAKAGYNPEDLMKTKQSELSSLIESGDTIGSLKKSQEIDKLKTIQEGYNEEVQNIENNTKRLSDILKNWYEEMKVNVDKFNEKQHEMNTLYEETTKEYFDTAKEWSDNEDKNIKNPSSVAFSVSDSLRRTGGFASSSLRMTENSRIISLTERIALSNEQIARNTTSRSVASNSMQWNSSYNPSGFITV